MCDLEWFSKIQSHITYYLFTGLLQKSLIYLVVKITDFLHQMCLCNITQIHFIREFTDLSIREQKFTEKVI